VNTVVSGGAVLLESAKSVISGGFTFVGSGGTLEATTIVSSGYGDLAVISGFGAGDVIDERLISAGATLSTSVSGGNVLATITSGGTSAIFTLAGSGGVTGSAYASGLSLVGDNASGVALAYTPPPPVNLVVSATVTSSALSVTSGNSITVLSGGTMSAIAVSSGGSAVISNGGEDLASTILAGGTETVSGDANGDQIYGVQIVTSGPSGGTLPATVENETVFNGGTVELFLKPDIGTNITVSSGGSLLLSGNVSAVDTTLDSGAYMALESPKAVISGGLTFNGPATVAITATTSAGYGDLGVISGFGAGDIIDETLISGSVATLTTTTSGGNTVETISGATFPDSFTFAGTAIAANIALVSDGGTGSELVYQAACMATGTRLRTATGECAIEALRVGDRLVTASGAMRPVRWIGYRSLDLHRHPRPHDVMPVRVQAHAVAPGCPSRDLLLSPDHAVFIGGALIPVRYLLNGASIAQEAAERITWWHVELDAHDVILAEGMPTESYLDTGNRAAFANAGPGHAVQVHPDFSRSVWAAEACAELVTAGPILAEVRAALLARLPELGHALTTDPDLRLVADGLELPPQCFGEWLCVALPAQSTELRLRSRVFQPAALQADGSDWRRLGVAITGLRVDGDDVALDAPAFGEGWLAAEGGLRWSGAEAVLHVPAGSVVELRISSMGRYAVPPRRGQSAAA
jgi:hypothetical protein